MLRWIIATLFFVARVRSVVEFDNSIPEKPEIYCSNGELRLNVSTAKGIAPSHVFVKGHFRKEGCWFSNSPNATFEFNKCDVSRQREVSPKGMAYTMTIVVQLHPLFTTKVDRAYRVRCFYKEAEKSVGAEVSVSDPTPTLLSKEAEQPTCIYTIHKDSPNGPLTNMASIGDVLYHVWECPSDAYEMYVHDCFVAGDSSRKVIDSLGCSPDVFIMPHTVYNANRTRAHVNSNAFNLPDQTSIRFTCQIQICPTISDCYRPNCNDPAASSPVEDAEPLGNELARDELITQTTTTTVITTTTTIPYTTSTTQRTVIEATTRSDIIDSTRTTTDFPTPDSVFRLLKGIRNLNLTSTDNVNDDNEGSGLEIGSTDVTRTTKRDIRRRDAIDVDISSPELMIVDRDFASDLPSPQEQQGLPQLDTSSSGSFNGNSAVCLPFFMIWLLAGVIIFAISLTFSALIYSFRKNPRFQVLA